MAERGLLGEQFLEFAGLVHFHENVASADEFAINVDLRNRGPVGEFLDSLADFGVFEDIDVLEVDTGGLENFRGAVGESALREVFGALHEEHDAVLLDDFLDSSILVTHVSPSAVPNVA